MTNRNDVHLSDLLDMFTELQRMFSQLLHIYKEERAKPPQHRCDFIMEGGRCGEPLYYSPKTGRYAPFCEEHMKPNMVDNRVGGTG